MFHLADRYEFRIVGGQVQVYDQISDSFRRVLRAGDGEQARAMLLEHWKDVRFEDDAETRGTFKAFS